MPNFALDGSRYNVVQTHVQIVKYCRVAPVALWAFEYLLTLDDEVENIWKAQQWSYTHGIFFTVRYLPVVSFLCANFYALMGLEMDMCLRVYKAYFSTLLILVVTTEGVLCLRTLALWHRHKLVRGMIIALYMAVCIAATACIAVSLTLDLDSVCNSSAQAMTLNKFVDNMRGLEESQERVMMGSFLAVAIFEFVVVCLTVVHGFMVSPRTSSSRLMASLRGGNLLYASALLAISILNTIYFHLPVEAGWTGLFDVFQVVLHGVMASRIKLALRAANNIGGTDRIRKLDSIKLRGFAPTMQFIPYTEHAARWNSSIDAQP
ncbi:hypothetical protein CONPUDRAFT_144308 [Coniophora puteana RWD-64-598 SS2]|uniref:DUF6533 domain-containing protein n=1 Tax=Coniophora puteana (strain RWD-64-598) TaxID=741705 RepID=A0A5M3MRA7_CONPW|nr:uncharacterized protein CONPUDRAFT_144308 [Coniophora puteana RWD-64-598 SS2]EIW81606.1 hypothetical protein CONPUDRAFT_144308 [Coniophora puteana RWD-64-598 SS2]